MAARRQRHHVQSAIRFVLIFLVSLVRRRSPSNRSAAVESSRRGEGKESGGEEERTPWRPLQVSRASRNPNPKFPWVRFSQNRVNRSVALGGYLISLSVLFILDSMWIRVCSGAVYLVFCLIWGSALLWVLVPREFLGIFTAVF
jgi:hypothetical protein